MNCGEFRRAAGAAPTALPAEARAHEAECAACATYARQLLELEPKLKAAFAIAVPPASSRVRRPLALPLAMAAAAVLAAVLAVILFGPRQSLAAAVAEHVSHEPNEWQATAPVPEVELKAVLAASGVSLLPGGPTVSYAHSCKFRGHIVPHLVVQTGSGPVTVMVLPFEHVARPTPFSEQGYRGLIVPTRHGALAFLSPGQADVPAAVSAVEDRVRYD